MLLSFVVNNFTSHTSDHATITGVEESYADSVIVNPNNAQYAFAAALFFDGTVMGAFDWFNELSLILTIHLGRGGFCPYFRWRCGLHYPSIWQEEANYQALCLA